MNFEQLLALEAIVETGSFRGAGEKLNKVQSAVSNAIKLLESQLGFQLFDRNKYRPQLTQKGEIFYRQSQKILQQMDELSELGQFLNLGYEPELTLIMSALVPMQILTPALMKTQKKYPLTHFKFIQDVLSADEQVTKIKANLALTEVEIQSTNFVSKNVLQVPMLPVCAGPKSVTEKDVGLILESQPQVILSSTGQTRSRQVAVINQSRTLSVTDFQTKKIFLLNRIGWGYMPEHLVKEELKKKTLSLMPLKKLMIPLKLYYETKPGPALAHFQEALLEECIKSRTGKS